jgi:hypothetical protein
MLWFPQLLEGDFGMDGAYEDAKRGADMLALREGLWWIITATEEAEAAERASSPAAVALKRIREKARSLVEVTTDAMEENVRKIQALIANGKPAQMINADQLIHNLNKLPPFCFSTLPENPTVLIQLRRGEMGYTPMRTHATAEEAAEQAARLNDGPGLAVTEHQLQAMRYGSCFGWDKPIADPDHWASLEYASPGEPDKE